MIRLYAHLDRQQAALFSLVLQAVGIDHRLRPDEDGLCLEAPASQAERARATIERYLQENPVPDTPCPTKPVSGVAAAYLSGLFVALLLLSVHLAVITSVAPQDYVAVFGGDAARVLRGEVYRCVTALLLHADAAHLAGNLAGVLLFGGAVCSVTGIGVGWLAILACGVLGNGLNAFVRQTAHLSVGASTAVFAAVGMVSALQAAAAKRAGRGWRRAGLALVAGLGLLAWLGVSARSDLGAHLFGFFSGALAGAVLARWPAQRAPAAVQWGCAGLALGTLVVAWLWGALGGG